MWAIGYRASRNGIEPARGCDPSERRGVVGFDRDQRRREILMQLTDQAVAASRLGERTVRAGVGICY